jgi:hypothetical protein
MGKLGHFPLPIHATVISTDHHLLLKSHRFEDRRNVLIERLHEASILAKLSEARRATRTSQFGVGSGVSPTCNGMWRGGVLSNFSPLRCRIRFKTCSYKDATPYIQSREISPFFSHVATTAPRPVGRTGLGG